MSLDGNTITTLLHSLSPALARSRVRLGRLLGLTCTEVDLVLAVALAERLCPTAVQAKLDMSSGGATAVMQRLERLGILRREPDPEDPLATLVALTTAGELELAAAQAPLGDLASGLTTTERRTVARYLSALLAAAEQK